MVLGKGVLGEGGCFDIHVDLFPPTWGGNLHGYRRGGLREMLKGWALIWIGGYNPLVRPFIWIGG